MAQALALELYFLVEKLLEENSPLVEAVAPHWRNEYFEDLVATWKRMDRHTAELAEVKRSVQQLAALMLPVQVFESTNPPSWHGGAEVGVSKAEPIDFCPRGVGAESFEATPSPAPSAGVKRGRGRGGGAASSSCRKRVAKKVVSLSEVDV